MTERVEIIEKHNYEPHLNEAEKRIGKSDLGDVPFLALALSRPNDGIWTENVKHFKNAKVKLWTTKELMRIV